LYRLRDVNRTVAAVILGGLSLLVGVGVFLVITSNRAHEAAGWAEWPAGLGSLASVPQRYPPHETNEAARRLIELAKPLGISFSRNDRAALLPQLDPYVRAEAARADLTIGALPADLATFLTTHERELDAIRDHLLASQIVWHFDPADGFEAEAPHYLAIVTLSRVFIARSLVRAADEGAWNELQAVWRLASSLLPRPEIYTQTVALALLRQISATAWKLPLPAPAWLAEVHAVDLEMRLAAAMQFEAWLMWHYSRAPFAFLRPLGRLMVANYAGRDREAVAGLLRVRTCAFDTKSFAKKLEADLPSWNPMPRYPAINTASFWARIFRYRAEREATANVIRAAAALPLVQSQCSDGSWRGETLPDGSVRVVFSKEIAPALETDTRVPLTRVRTRRGST
jgi:hypothetical protein